MFWRKRGALTEPARPPAPATEPVDVLVDEFLETWIYWREACGDVDSAYVRWAHSAAEQRDLAFAGYRAALDREDQAARVHSIWTDRLRAAKPLRGRPR
jgi:hypothetical protein